MAPSTDDRSNKSSTSSTCRARVAVRPVRPALAQRRRHVAQPDLSIVGDLRSAAQRAVRRAVRIAKNWEVEQGYAQILTHPGVPTVYWKQYFDWGPDLRSKIQALIDARKVAGVHAGSALHLQSNAQMNGS